MAFSFCTAAGGVPAGAHMPNQSEMLKSARPCSASVARSGSTSARRLVDTPSARSLPSFSCPMVVLIGAM